MTKLSLGKEGGTWFFPEVLVPGVAEPQAWLEPPVQWFKARRVLQSAGAAGAAEPQAVGVAVPQMPQVQRVPQAGWRARMTGWNSGAVLCRLHILSNIGRNTRAPASRPRKLKRSVTANLVQFTCGKKFALTNNCNLLQSFSTTQEHVTRRTRQIRGR